MIGDQTLVVFPGDEDGAPTVNRSLADAALSLFLLCADDAEWHVEPLR